MHLDGLYFERNYERHRARISSEYSFALAEYFVREPFLLSHCVGGACPGSCRRHRKAKMLTKVASHIFEVMKLECSDWCHSLGGHVIASAEAFLLSVR